MVVSKVERFKEMVDQMGDERLPKKAQAKLFADSCSWKAVWAEKGGQTGPSTRPWLALRHSLEGSCEAGGLRVHSHIGRPHRHHKGVTQLIDGACCSGCAVACCSSQCCIGGGSVAIAGCRLHDKGNKRCFLFSG